MTAQLTWLEASRLNVGDRVVFVEAHDIFPEALVAPGTKATVTEIETAGAVWVKPDDLGLQAKLAEWDGEIMLSPPRDREDSGNREPAWSQPSPLAKVALTFSEFQAMRRWCDDLGKAIADSRWDGEPPAKGNLYLGALYIEEVQPHWPDAAKARGKWHLLIGRDEWISDDLTMLEKHLYDFAMEEGYGD
jgi:hypothetical protein